MSKLFKLCLISIHFLDNLPGVVVPGFFVHNSLKNVDDRFEPSLLVGISMWERRGLFYITQQFIVDMTLATTLNKAANLTPFCWKELRNKRLGTSKTCDIYNLFTLPCNGELQYSAHICKQRCKNTGYDVSFKTHDIKFSSKTRISLKIPAPQNKQNLKIRSWEIYYTL